MHCKLCPWKLVRRHIYKMFCWFRSLAGGESSWLKIHGWSHIPRTSFWGTFSHCREKLLSTVLPAVSKNTLVLISALSDFWPFFLVCNCQNGNRMSSILAKTLEMNNKRTLGLLCEKGQYKLECFIARRLIGSKGSCKEFGALVWGCTHGALFKLGWWKLFCTCITYTGL